MTILVNIGIFFLILVSILLVLLVLMQRAKNDGGVAAMGGGIAEATFGADTGNVLSKFTINLSIAFFVLAFLTGMGTIYLHRHADTTEQGLPNITAPATAPLESSIPLPAAPAGTATTAATAPAEPVPAAPTPTPAQ